MEQRVGKTLQKVQRKTNDREWDTDAWSGKDRAVGQSLPSELVLQTRESSLSRLVTLAASTIFDVLFADRFPWPSRALFSLLLNPDHVSSLAKTARNVSGGSDHLRCVHVKCAVNGGAKLWRQSAGTSVAQPQTKREKKDRLNGGNDRVSAKASSARART